MLVVFYKLNNYNYGKATNMCSAMRTLIKLVKYYPILVTIYSLTMMLTYVSGIRINVSTYLYTYIGHSFYINIRKTLVI